jgi:hypothetical protein
MQKSTVRHATSGRATQPKPLTLRSLGLGFRHGKVIGDLGAWTGRKPGLAPPDQRRPGQPQSAAACCVHGSCTLAAGITRSTVPGGVTRRPGGHAPLHKADTSARTCLPDHSSSAARPSGAGRQPGRARQLPRPPNRVFAACLQATAARRFVPAAGEKVTPIDQAVDVAGALGVPALGAAGGSAAAACFKGGRARRLIMLPPPGRPRAPRCSQGQGRRGGLRLQGGRQGRQDPHA